MTHSLPWPVWLRSMHQVLYLIKFGDIRPLLRPKRLQYESAKIAYENQMEFSHVTSPISGRVEQLNVEVHDTVGNSNQLCVIAETAAIM